MRARASEQQAPVHASLASAWKLSSAQAASLAKHCRTLSVARGEPIVRRGALLPGVLGVTSGTVKVSLKGHEGEERVLRIVRQGETFGEPTALLGKPSLYDAYALSDTALVVVPAPAILSLLERDARFGRRLVLALADRCINILAEFEAATTQRGAQRLASYLESLLKQNGSPDSTIVQLPVSKTVVAALLGMKKETLSRLLRQFHSDGIIDVSRREIAIRDRTRLVAAAHA